MYTNKQIKELLEAAFFPNVIIDLKSCSPDFLANSLEEQKFDAKLLLKKMISQVLELEKPHIEKFSQEGEFKITFSIQHSVKLAEEKKLSADIIVTYKDLSSTTYSAIFVSEEIIDIKKEIVSEKEEALEETEIKTIRILIVDDSIITHKLLKNLLNITYKELQTSIFSKKPEIDVAENGLQAFKKVENQHKYNKRYDLIFMNHQMPVMDGAEAILKIRQFEKDNHLEAQTIISLSASNEAEVSKEAGANEFIFKPIKKEDVTRILQQCILKSTSSDCDTLLQIQQVLNKCKPYSHNAKKIRKKAYSLFEKYCWGDDFPSGVEKKITASTEDALSFTYGFWGGLELFKMNLETCKEYQDSDYISNAEDYVWFLNWIEKYQQVASHDKIRSHTKYVLNFISKIEEHVKLTDVSSAIEEIKQKNSKMISTEKQLSLGQSLQKFGLEYSSAQSSEKSDSVAPYSFEFKDQ